MTDTVSIVKTYPYPIPENWHWTHLKEVASISKEKTDTFADSNIRYVGLEHMEKDVGIVSYGSPAEIKSTKNIFHAGQVLYGKLRPYLNKHDVAKFDGVCSTDILVLKVLPKAIPRFVDLFLNQRVFMEYAVSNSKGINLPRVSGKEVLEAVFPLPPVPEQQRIVDRIESLFAKLDEAKEKAQAVVDGFEDRKAAILHKAFTGELTAEWRKRNTEQQFRKKTTIREVCSSLAYGTASKSSKEGKVAVIRMGNLQGGEIDWDNLVFSNNDGDNVKYALSTGDVLFNRTNSAEHVGKTAIYRGERPAIYAGYLIKLDYDHSRIQGEYLNYLLNSPEAREYCKRVKTDAVNQSNINAQKIGAFEIPLVGMNEQEETCRLAKKMIGAEETIKDAAQNSIRQIDTMKKAILARAFRGELGTNDPSEPPADMSAL